jgi:hypothetical protein
VIYDHELALLLDGLIGWKEPWLPGAVKFPHGTPPERRHVFLEQLRGKQVDLSRFSGAFESISDVRLTEYEQAIPPEWIGDELALNRMLDYLRDLRDNVAGAVNAVRGALQ